MPMNKPSFEVIISTIAPVVTYTEDAIRVAQVIENLFDNYIPDQIISPDGKAEFNGVNWNFAHDSLVATALSNPDVMQDVAYARKIQAIKTLRNLTGCGLKQAKDAIEDKRVWQPDPEVSDHLNNYSTNPTNYAEDN